MKMSRCRILVLLVFLFLWGNSGLAQGEDQIFYIRSPESDTDNRLTFVQEIIKAVIDRTVESGGSYKLKPIPRMVFARISLAKTQYKYPNLIIRPTADYKSKEQFEVVPIPINRGIVGYRVFLIRKEMQPDFKEVYSLSDIQVKRLKAGQGRWTDVDILRDNGINVIVGMSYEGLFGMLMEKRFDFFPRGINEAFEEFETRKERYPEMQVEETLALHYPLPRV